MELALQLAAEHMRALEGGPFGAVITRDEEIVATGWNRVTSTNDPTAHAEIMALRLAGERMGTFVLTGCVLYASCEPCPMCLAAAYWARVDRIVFAGSRADAAQAGFDDERIYRELALPMESRRLPMRQLLQKQAQDVFAQWRDVPGKKMY